jgi:hypothetical protein
VNFPIIFLCNLILVDHRFEITGNLGIRQNNVELHINEQSVFEAMPPEYAFLRAGLPLFLIHAFMENVLAQGLQNRGSGKARDQFTNSDL